MQQLKDHQKKALRSMHNGCILCGGTGSGKSFTGLSYYHLLFGGKMNPNFKRMKNPKRLYIITPAKKRDSDEWEMELSHFMLSSRQTSSEYKGLPPVVVDSWNNILKYKYVEDAFFIFDEQRVVGYGAWAKTFIKIAKHNQWILLSATPGDTWSDYIPVMIANGYYRNKSDFERQHVVWKRGSKFPQIDHYVDCGKLIKQRKEILVTMEFDRPTVQKHINVDCSYDKLLCAKVSSTRRNPWTHKPIKTPSEYCACLRKIVNSDTSRLEAFTDIIAKHPKCIVFYNYVFEKDMLKGLLDRMKVPYTEWNGQKHEQIPETRRWCYLVQYSAGNEAWNCTLTDTIIFYSNNYSYKVMKQAAGRIDRLNTSFHELYYYHLTSRSPIDRAILLALNKKKSFNEKAFSEKSQKREEEKYAE